MLNADKPLTFMDNVFGNPNFLRALNKVKTSNEIQRLINKMLDENPKTRITIEQIVKSPLIAQEIINSRMLCFYKYLPA
jgi:serine/threonine protein kinase